MKKSWSYEWSEQRLETRKVTEELFKEAIAVRLAKNPEKEFANLKKYDELLKDAREGVIQAEIDFAQEEQKCLEEEKEVKDETN